MGRTRDVTEWQKGAIVFGREHGHSLEEVAAFVGLSKSTVSTIHQQWRVVGNTDSKRRNSGRKKIMTNRDRRQLSRLVMANRTQTRQELLQQYNAGPSQAVCERTLRRELHGIGIFSRVPRVRPRLTAIQRRTRLIWAKQHRHWTSEQWRSIIWSDESRFCLYSNDGRCRVMRRAGEAFNPDCVQRAVQKGGGSVMFWACISSAGPGSFVEASNRMKAVDYVKLLDDELVPFLQFLRDESHISHPQFQDDNCTVHRARIVQDWFYEHETDVPHLTWPANSPDLNVIEKVWDMLERAVKKRCEHPRNITALREQLTAEWTKLDVNVLLRHIDSMPNKIRAVIKAGGDVTPY